MALSELTTARRALSSHPSHGGKNDFLKLVLAFCDISAVMLSALASFLLMSGTASLLDIHYVSFGKLFDERLTALAMTSCCACLFFLFSGHYHMRIPFWEETKAVTTICLLSLLVEGFLIFANKADVSRASIFLSWAISPFAIMWGRALMRRVLAGSGALRTRSVVFGRLEETLRAVDIILADAHLGVTVVETQTSSDLDIALETLSRANASEAVIALSCADDAEIRLASDLRKRGYSVCVIPPAMGMSSNMNVHYILGRDAMLLSSRPEITPRLNRLSKRLFDIVVSGMLLAGLAVPMLIVAVGVSLDGGMPLFRHRRVGRDGKTFWCLKFRSMHVDAEARLGDYLASDPDAREAWETNRKLPDDPRVTAFGRFIRRTSIDELPQFLNVLVGDMSLVGPRPVTETELDHYGLARDLYTSVKPGVTGLWQVSGRSDLSYDRRVELDTWYVENWSPWHDIAIMSKTVPTVLRRRGAY